MEKRERVTAKTTSILFPQSCSNHSALQMCIRDRGNDGQTDIAKTIGFESNEEYNEKIGRAHV